jgi:hypothetical protein
LGFAVFQGVEEAVGVGKFCFLGGTDIDGEPEWILDDEVFVLNVGNLTA